MEEDSIRLIGMGLFGLGLCLLLITFLPSMIYLIFFVVVLAFLIYSWSSHSVWLKSIAIIIGIIMILTIWGIFSSSFMGLMFAAEILTESTERIEVLMTFLDTIPETNRILYGAVCIIAGLFLWKHRGISERTWRKNFLSQFH